jgi:hypothetical protein
MFSAKNLSEMVQVFSFAGKIGTPNETFLSLDWFLQDREIKLFAPSNSLLMPFFSLILPVVLWGGISLVFLIAKFIVFWIRPSYNYDTKRYIVVSSISILFLLHPNLTLEGLSAFQWIKIDDGDFRMKIHMEFGCFSREHVLWAILTGLPILLIWVISMPVLALYILIKNRHRLGKHSQY